jgi:hypothetical protein
MKFVYKNDGVKSPKKAAKKSPKKAAKKKSFKKMHDGTKKSPKKSPRKSPKKKRKPLRNITNLPQNWKQLEGWQDGKRRKRSRSPLKLKKH